MTEGMEEPTTTYQPNALTQVRQDLETAASEFRRNVQEAALRLSAAADQFSSVTGRLVAATDEVQAAAERAQEAQRAAEAVQSRIEKDYDELSKLLQDLQERIAALAVLARPLPVDRNAQPAVSSEDAAEAAEGNTSPGWSGG